MAIGYAGLFVPRVAQSLQMRYTWFCEAANDRPGTKGEKMANGVTCGNCRQKHATAADVKACYAGKATANDATGMKLDYRPNRYAGTCYRCGGRVEAMAGAIERGETRWTARHLDGECPAPQKTAPARKDYSAIAPGYYATVSATGENDFDFWYVKAGRKPGYRFVKRYIGGQGPIRIRASEALRALDEIIAEGVDKCGDRFSDELEKCRDCGLPLTDEISRRERRGPICRNK